jgi:hypothetical protein
MTIPADPDNLRNYVENNFPGHEVHCAYEADCCGYSTHRAFLVFGWQSLVFNSAKAGMYSHTTTPLSTALINNLMMINI